MNNQFESDVMHCSHSVRLLCVVVAAAAAEFSPACADRARQSVVHAITAQASYDCAICQLILSRWYIETQEAEGGWAERGEQQTANKNKVSCCTVKPVLSGMHLETKKTVR